jgi:hypothetical protein
MAKVKNLKKKIRRLEARLQKGAKKLAKLKRKLETAATVTAAGKTKATSPEGRSALRGNGKMGSVVKGQGVARKEKKKLNLTPERRAQLSATMKARWAAKRAAAAASTQNSSSSPGSPGHASGPQ